MRSNWQIKVFVFALLAIWGLPLVAGQSPFTEAFFKPFAYLDIERIYETYHAIIDFNLFTLSVPGTRTASRRSGGTSGSCPRRGFRSMFPCALWLRW